MLLPRPKAPPTITESDVRHAEAAARCVVTVHQRLAEFLKVGQTLAQIDTFVAQQLADLNCKSCFIGYKPRGMTPFPSHACLSLNDCVVHGTATYTTKPIEPGDILKIDIGVSHRGWIGDAAWTYAVRERTPTAAALMDCGKTSLIEGVKELRPGNMLMQWARRVHTIVEGYDGTPGWAWTNPATGKQTHGFHLIRGLGGHGYGKRLHETPWISNVVPDRPGEWPEAGVECAPGMLVAVEPMLAIGTGRTKEHGSNWPIFTADGSLAVHYEHDVLVTPQGPRVLTADLESLPDVVG